MTPFTNVILGTFCVELISLCLQPAEVDLSVSRLDFLLLDLSLVV